MWVEVGGKTEKKKEDLESPPSGWRWEGDWKVVPENSSTFKPEEGLNEWTEEIFENQNRSLLSDWPDESKSYWTDLVNTLEAVVFSICEPTYMYTVIAHVCMLIKVCIVQWLLIYYPQLH